MPFLTYKFIFLITITIHLSAFIVKMSSSNESKIGFWTLISIVISAQLGASVFLMPSALAPFRTVGILGWIIAGIGAVLITIIFSYLCTQTAKTGGPHIYAEMFFGEKVGFFVTWVYWCAAWACNPIMIATAVNYLISCTGDLSIPQKLSFEILLVLSLTLINIKGIKTAGCIEMILTILKIVPLIIIPIIAFTNINMENFKEPLPEGTSVLEAVTKAAILSFWGFVGLEGGTSPSGAVNNPKRTIPLAIVLGTAFVAIVCIVNTIAVFGVISPSELESVGAPFAYIMVKLFGNGYDKIIGIVTFLMCAGSLNAWVLFSGQIAETAAASHVFPKIFSKKNKNGAPYYALWISAIGTIVILFLQKTDYIGDKIVKFLDMSVIVYVFLYFIAILAYIKFYITQKRDKKVTQAIIMTLAFMFCLVIIFNSDMLSFIALVTIILAGIPVFVSMSINKK